MPPPEKDRSYKAWLEYLEVKFGLETTLDNIMDEIMEEVDRLAKEARARDKAGSN